MILPVDFVADFELAAVAVVAELVVVDDVAGGAAVVAAADLAAVDAVATESNDVEGRMTAAEKKLTSI